MIKLDSLILKNFMNVSYVELKFENKFTILQGNNGQGKSTILEALALCFIERRRGDSFRDYIKIGEKKAEIQLKAFYKGKPLQFELIINPPTICPPLNRKIIYDGKIYNNSECSNLLNTFGLDYLNIVMFSLQGENNIIELKPAERISLLKRIVNFSFEEQLNILNEKIKESNESLIFYKTKIDILRKQVYEIEPLKNVLTPQQEIILQNELKELNNQYEIYLKTLNIENLLKKENDIKQKINQFEELLNRNLKDLEREQLNLKKSNENIKYYKQQLNDLQSPEILEKQIIDLEKNLNDLTTNLEKEKDKLKEIEFKINEININISLLKNQILHAKNGYCNYCGQEISNTHFINLQNKLDSNLGNWENMINDLKLEENKLKTNINQLNSIYIENKNKLNNLIRKKDNYDEDLKKLNIYIKLEEENIQNYQEKINYLSNYIGKLNFDLKIENEELNKINNLLDKNHEIVEKVNIIKTKIKEITIELQNNEISKKLNQKIEENNKKILQQKEENELSIKEYEEKYIRELDNINIYKDVKKILEIDLPNYIILKTCNYLESLMNNFIQKINKDMGVKLALTQKKNGIDFFYNNGSYDEENGEKIWLSCKMGSGFEKELLSISFRIALSRMFGLNVLFLDECDANSSTENSIKIFKEISNLPFHQILIITHKPDIPLLLKQENDDVKIYKVEKGCFYLQ